MKKYLYILAALALLAACKKNDSTPVQEVPAVSGVWELTSVTTKVSVGNVEVSVYIDFSTEKTFTLYQKIGEGRYTRFEGLYAIEQDRLSGTYSDGTAWGPYLFALDGDKLSLTSAGKKEVDTYKKIEAVPESVSGNVY
ncbi:MAG: lipocalin family protein [Bacteroidales bacterium]|nr:lipocalin family protein [Bacteroidales bacterium]